MQYQHWKNDLRDQLSNTILPYWAEQMLDPEGGPYGGRGLHNELHDYEPRTAVLGARVLWTFATAAVVDPDPRWRAAAEHSWAWVRDRLQDPEFGGVYWSVGRGGQIIAAHKQTYAQGFAIYGAVAMARLGNAEALDFAKRVFAEMEAAYDGRFGGYFEGCTRSWRVREDARLSPKEPRAAKSMNTMLHVLEPLTELVRQVPQDAYRERLETLLALFIDRIWSPERRSFGMFFEADWTPLSETISYGHDIETSWLLRRACEVLPGWSRAHEVDQIVREVGHAVLERGVAADGSVLAEGEPCGPTSLERHWWGQAEGMVGFWDAYEVSGDAAFANAARRCWEYIKAFHVDPAGGDWFKVLDASGSPLRAYGKAGPWECPYHHARACIEMLHRLER